MIGLFAAATLGVVAGTLLHEAAHWLVFRLSGVRAAVSLLPPAVVFPDGVPAHVIAWAAIAPVLPAAVLVAGLSVSLAVGSWPGGELVAGVVACALRCAKLSATDRAAYREAMADSQLYVGVPVDSDNV